jgi:hypothetical protein
MYVNRAQALLLVGTISAGGLSCEDEELPASWGTAGTAGTAGAGGSSSAGSAGQGGAGGTSSAGSAGQGGTGGTPSAGGGGTGGTPSAGGSSQSVPDAGDVDAGNADAGDADGPDAGRDAGGAPTCDDTSDTVVSCSDLGQADCSGLEGFLSSECEMVAFYMKPAAANAARNCMIDLDPPELCNTTNPHTCIVEALASSCPDPEADDECATIVAACGSSALELGECSSALSGMTQSGRDQMVQCMTEPCDLFSCIEGLN